MPERHLPFKIAELILRYTHNLLSEKEADTLDGWITASDENLSLFEELTTGVLQKIVSLDDIIIETDNTLDTWMVAGLLARKLRGIISEDEERFLREWQEAHPEQEKLFRLLSTQEGLSRYAAWFNQLQQNNNPSLPELN